MCSISAVLSHGTEALFNFTMTENSVPCSDIVKNITPIAEILTQPKIRFVALWGLRFDLTEYLVSLQCPELVE